MPFSHMNFGVFFHSCPFSYVAHSRKGSAKGSDRGLGERAAWVEHVAHVMSTVLMVNVAESYRLCWTALTSPCWVALFILK